MSTDGRRSTAPGLPEDPRHRVRPRPVDGQPSVPGPAGQTEGGRTRGPTPGDQATGLLGDRAARVEARHRPGVGGPHGTPVIPEKFKSCDQLVPAYQQVLKDGGIGELRRVIKCDVVEAVQAEVRAEVRRRLAKLQERLLNQIQNAKEGGPRPQDLTRAAEWGAAIGAGVIEPCPPAEHLRAAGPVDHDQAQGPPRQSRARRSADE